MFLSIIIPAYREGERLLASLVDLRRYLSTQKYASEILVVENGERVDPSPRSQFDGEPLVRWIWEPRRGKGLAVRRGMLEAVGQYRFFCDADLSMPVDQISRFLPPQICGVDLAIGSRELPGARRHNQPRFRHLMGHAFNRLVRWSVLEHFSDTQCGFKCFARHAAEDLFRTQLIDGMCFDVEVIYIARQRSYRIQEVPIDWYYREGSRVRILRDSLQMVGDIMRIRRNWAAGRYAARHKTQTHCEIAAQGTATAEFGPSTHSDGES